MEGDRAESWEASKGRRAKSPPPCRFTYADDDPRRASSMRRRISAAKFDGFEIVVFLRYQVTNWTKFAAREIDTGSDLHKESGSLSAIFNRNLWQERLTIGSILSAH